MMSEDNNKKWWNPALFEAKIPCLHRRAKMIQDIRSFFENRDYLEVETTALQTSPGMEVHSKGFETELYGPDRGVPQTKYLHSSPELAMKKLLVAGLPKIFQICQVFRNAEGSKLHRPSFTMLEWYQVGLSYEGLMQETIELIRYISDGPIHWRGITADPDQDWQMISVADSFQHYADIDLCAVLEDREGLAKEAERLDCDVHDGDRWEDIFFKIFGEKIEPHLGAPVPTILYDYPLSMAALSRRKADDARFAERFEVYICGMELANAFGELTDAEEQRARFERSMEQKRKIYGEDYPVDDDFIEALAFGMPETSGIALGIDRMAMLLSGVDDIRFVQAVG